MARLGDVIRARLTPSDLIRLGSSLILALLLWGWVTTREDPETTRTFPGVTVEVAELPDDLVVVSSPPNVTVTLKGPRSVISRVDSSEVSAHLDLDGIDAPGSTTVDIVVTAPDGVWERRAVPSRFPIHVERTTSKNFKLEPVIEDDLDATRRIGQIQPSVSQVTVSGPESLVNSVIHVVLPINIGDATREFTGAFTPEPRDANGQPITGLTISPSSVTATVPIEAAGKSVAVTIQTVGSPAQGYDVIDRVANPSTVRVDGPQNQLDGMVIVKTEPIDISGAKDDVSKRVALQGLPPDVRVIEPASGTVEVYVQIGQRGVRQELPALKVDVINLGQGLAAEVTPSDVTVVVVASGDIIAALTSADLMIQVDAEGLGQGEYHLRPTVSLPPNVQWISTNPTTVTVVIRKTNRAPAAGSPAASPVALP
jgi:YbbR domain-containing protein